MTVTTRFVNSTFTNSSTGNKTHNVAVNLADDEYITGFCANFSTTDNSYENDRIWAVRSATLIDRNTMRFNIYREAGNSRTGSLYICIIINKFVIS